MNSMMVWPMLALIVLTLIVVSTLPISRILAIMHKKAHIRDFRYGDTSSIPEHVRLINCNYRNLLEMPLLFYVTCFLMIVLGHENEYSVNIAWAYVIFRVIHSVIHIGYNNVNHRFLAFAASFICLIFLVVELFVGLTSA